MTDGDIGKLRRLTQKEGSPAARRWLVENRGFDADSADALVESLVDEQSIRDDALREVIDGLPISLVTYGILWYAFFTIGPLSLPLYSITGGTLLVLLGVAGAARWIRNVFYPFYSARRRRR